MIDRIVRFAAVSAAVVLIATLTAGCSNPFGGSSGGSSGSDTAQGTTGTLRVAGVQPFADGIGALSVFPENIPDQVTHFRISVTNGPEGEVEVDGETVNGAELEYHQVVAFAEGQLTEDVVFADLIPGDWAVTARGYDADPQAGEPAEQLLEGSTTVTIVRGHLVETDGPIVVKPLTGEDALGSWEITIRWPVEVDPDYAVTDVVTKVEYSTDDGETWADALELSEAEEIGTSAGGNQREIVFGEQEIQAGSFPLAVRLQAEDKAGTPYEYVRHYFDEWYVFGGLLTQRAFEFTADTFSAGGGLMVDPDQDPDPELIVIETLSDPAELSNWAAEGPVTVTAGQPVTFEVDFSEVTPEYYAWRVNGAVQAEGEEENSFTLATTEAQAGLVRTVTLVVTVDGNDYSGSRSVRIVAPE